uniref:CCHC-type domain-containing protein n=1 Tax=Peronospora matthiolae TaxID=2874970 RepID=A0AAV1U6D6_9STRA
MDASSLRISKFDGTNFHAWKFKMQMVLEERDLWEVVSGEIKAEHHGRFPATVGPVGKWCMRRMVKVGRPLREKKSLANKLFLRRRFFTTMMEEGDDVLEHINKLKTLAEQLEAVGAPVCEDDLVITLLGSLSDSYQFLITALESRSDTLSWELVTSRLLHEEMKRKEQGSKGDEASQGQAFITRDNQRKGRPVKKSWPCHNCGKIGHWMAECPSRIQENTERHRPQRAQDSGDRYRSQRANVAQEEDSGDYLFRSVKRHLRNRATSGWSTPGRRST